MDINFDAPPFSGYNEFTNKEIESIWNNLQKKNQKF